jgi:hypothetical protein
MNKYTHVDGSGMQWRMNGSRPVSALADKTMHDVGLPCGDPNCVACTKPKAKKATVGQRKKAESYLVEKLMRRRKE